MVALNCSPCTTASTMLVPSPCPTTIQVIRSEGIEGARAEWLKYKPRYFDQPVQPYRLRMDGGQERLAMMMFRFLVVPGRGGNGWGGAGLPLRQGVYEGTAD